MSDKKQYLLDELNYEFKFKLDSEKALISVISQKYENVVNNKSFKAIYDYKPGVYFFHNVSDNEIYIGESASPFLRLEQHLKSGKLKSDSNVYVFTSLTFNKSAIYDIETKLIDYFVADGIFTIKNEKLNQSDYEYFMKDEYDKAFISIWEYLLRNKVVSSDMKTLESREIFKFSPYKLLNPVQDIIISSIESRLRDKTMPKYLQIIGEPGTGKTIVASTLFYRLMVDGKKVAITSGTKATTEALKDVFKATIKKYDDCVVKSVRELLRSDEYFDIIIVDESQRLKKFETKADHNSLKHLNEDEDEFSLLKTKCKTLILLHDKNQEVHIVDGGIGVEIPENDKFELTQQMRAKNGKDFIRTMIDFLDGKDNQTYVNSKDYFVHVFEDFSTMYDKLIELSKTHKMTRLVSGQKDKEYSRKNGTILIGFNNTKHKLIYNTDATTWIRKNDSANLLEVGYYQAVQGFDLEYVGVVIREDLYIDNHGEIAINEKIVPWRDKPRKNDPDYNKKLRDIIVNRYKVLLSRGASGVLIFAEDKKLNQKLAELFNS